MSSSRSGYHHGDLAHALETAAMQLLAEKPAQEISLREVARAADVSHNAPYHHFADRRGLLKVLAERSMADLVAAVRGAISDADEPVAGLVAGGAAYLRFAVEHPHGFDVIYDPAVCIPGEPSETMAPLIAELEQLLGSASVAAGLPAEESVLGVWGLVHGLGTLCAAGHFTLEAALDGSAAAIRRMLPR
ncbi:TetR/AcrR family transcriptional regulator [Microbacterium sp. SD291]|uniref:TetR/AcrR family transcriptional regulator n=1 Tax=Microbacterium sp. SD291 TaxID=2782007 RepID=UPI001A963CE1|nr:TetR/AcrR family transcriptional regulator [Microbacterium sp. SD291]MBO0981553.1 TetR/AcrR family transcriptional regulator [Microbacterium sp. SD291]